MPCVQWQIVDQNWANIYFGTFPIHMGFIIQPFTDQPELKFIFSLLANNSLSLKPRLFAFYFQWLHFAISSWGSWNGQRRTTKTKSRFSLSRRQVSLFNFIRAQNWRGRRREAMRLVCFAAPSKQSLRKTSAICLSCLRKTVKKKQEATIMLHIFLSIVRKDKTVKKIYNTFLPLILTTIMTYKI